MYQFLASSTTSNRSSVYREILQLDQNLPKNPPTATLSYSGNTEEDTNYQSIMRAIGEVTSFSSLELNLAELNSVRVKHLTDALKANLTLKNLTIKCWMYPEVFQLFMEELQKRSEKISLDFQFDPNGRDFRNISLFNSGPAFAATLSTLTALSFSNCYLMSHDMRALGAALLQNTSLESLDMSKNTFVDGSYRPLAAAIAVNDTLRTLKMNWATVLGDELPLVLKMLGINTSLQQLELIGNNYDDASYPILLDLLKEHPTLEMLHMEAAWLMQCLETETFDDAFGSNSKLKTLVLSDIRISNLSIASFTSLMKKLMESKSLQDLSLTNLTIYDESASDALVALIENVTIISQITILKNYCSLEVSKRLSLAISSNHSTKSYSEQEPFLQRKYATAASST